MQKLVLFDIDGTLSDIDIRRKILDKDPHNWKEFFDKMGDDIPNKAVVELYQIIWSNPQYKCVILTGRPDNYRKLTEQWLIWNDIPFDRLIMRDKNDQRADHIIKEQILKTLQSENNEIAFVIDDRQSVVDMWRRNGICCLQCAVYEG